MMAEPDKPPASSGLNRVAQVYSTTEAALTVCALEGAGIRVFVPGFQTVSTLPHLSVALGGMPVLVDEENAAEAAALLEEIRHARRDSRPAAVASHRRRVRPLHLAMMAFYILTGTAPPLHGRFPADRLR